MKRLLGSSKFWAIVVGIGIAIVLRFVVPAVQPALDQLIAVSPLGFVIVAFLGALEDVAAKLKAGEAFDLEMLIRTLVKEILDELLSDDDSENPGPLPPA